jgi:hypothetical protein
MGPETETAMQMYATVNYVSTGLFLKIERILMNQEQNELAKRIGHGLWVKDIPFSNYEVLNFVQHRRQDGFVSRGFEDPIGGGNSCLIILRPHGCKRR